jgi:hypothetical protein
VRRMDRRKAPIMGSFVAAAGKSSRSAYGIAAAVGPSGVVISAHPGEERAPRKAPDEARRAPPIRCPHR